MLPTPILLLLALLVPDGARGALLTRTPMPAETAVRMCQRNGFTTPRATGADEAFVFARNKRAAPAAVLFCCRPCGKEGLSNVLSMSHDEKRMSPEDWVRLRADVFSRRDLVLAFADESDCETFCTAIVGPL